LRDTSFKDLSQGDPERLKNAGIKLSLRMDVLFEREMESGMLRDL